MEILGLPLHPLIIHAVVVLVPLAALGGVACSVLRWARIRYASLVLVGAFGATVSTFVAQQAGESLYDSLPQHSPDLERHAALGPTLFPWTVVLFAGTVVLVIAQRLLDREHPRGRLVLVLGAVLTIVGAGVSTVLVTLIGHLGAIAVWG